MGLGKQEMFHNVVSVRLHTHNALPSSLLDFIHGRIDALDVPALRDGDNGVLLGHQILFCDFAHALHHEFGPPLVAKRLLGLRKLLFDDAIYFLGTCQSRGKFFDFLPDFFELVFNFLALQTS